MSHPILDSQRAKVEALERDLAHERAVLLGMEMVIGQNLSKLTKPTYAARASAPARRSSATGGGGKTPGQLSMAWRSVLSYFYTFDLKFTEDDAATQYGFDTGKEMRPRDVKRRLLAYAAEHQFLEIEPDSRFRVTEVAAERFGFARSPKNGAVSDPGQGQTAAPHLFGSREGGEGYRTPTT